MASPTKNIPALLRRVVEKHYLRQFFYMYKSYKAFFLRISKNMKRLLILFTTTLLCVGCINQYTAPSKIPMTNGHRGANAIAPENTMASADSCIKYGVDYMECDVCISKDSVFYLLHDSTLNRTTNGTGVIGDWLSADIDTLDAGSWFGSEFKGQRVPRLADLLVKAKDNGLRLTIDYRNGDIRKLLDLIKSKDMLKNCNFTFYNEETTKYFRHLAPELKTLQAYVKNKEDLERVVKEVKPNVAVIWIDSLTPELISKCHQYNLQVMALALGLEDMTTENQRAVDLGVDVIATDRPEQFIMKYGKSNISGE